MPATYEPIATTTLSTTSTSIAFTNIPGTYTDLVLKVVFRVTTITGGIVTINGDINANYSRISLNGNGTAGVTSNNSTNDSDGITWSSGFSAATTSQVGWTIMEFDFFSYTNSTFKTALQRWSNDLNGSGQVNVHANLWRSTSAITSIDINSYGQNVLAAGSTATLYGIKAA